MSGIPDLNIYHDGGRIHVWWPNDKYCMIKHQVFEDGDWKSFGCAEDAEVDNNLITTIAEHLQKNKI